eukprot:sb/3470872/
MIYLTTEFQLSFAVKLIAPRFTGTPIYRAKPFPPSIPVNRGPTVQQNTISLLSESLYCMLLTPFLSHCLSLTLCLSISLFLSLTLTLFLTVTVSVSIHLDLYLSPSHIKSFSYPAAYIIYMYLYLIYTVGPRFTGPRYTGTPIYREIKFPRSRKLTIFHPDIPGTPIYRAKSFPPKIPVNRGPTVLLKTNIQGGP